MYVCVCVYIYIYIYVYAYTHIAIASRTAAANRSCKTARGCVQRHKRLAVERACNGLAAHGEEGMRQGSRRVALLNAESVQIPRSCGIPCELGAGHGMIQCDILIVKRHILMVAAIMLTITTTIATAIMHGISMLEFPYGIPRNNNYAHNNDSNYAHNPTELHA